jgi:hypothetical protein
MILELAAVSESEPVTFKDFKEWARRYLPADSAVRQAFEDEPDDLSSEFGLPKLETLNRMLRRELSGRR